MKRNCLLLVSVCLLVFALVPLALAQDAKVDGSWDLSAPGRGGNMVTQTLTLQQDGTKLTGSLKSQRGDNPITGTIMGNNIAFSVSINTPNGGVKIDYTGTVSGDSMKGTRSVNGNSTDWTAKRSAAAGGNGN
jgi:hypothetical protein